MRMRNLPLGEFVFRILELCGEHEAQCAPPYDNMSSQQSRSSSSNLESLISQEDGDDNDGQDSEGAYDEEGENTRDNIDTTLLQFECFLVIAYDNNKLGVSFYRSGYDKYQLLHEVNEYYDFAYIKTILRKAEPTDVILSSKCDAHLLNYLQWLSANEPHQSTNQESGETAANTTVELDDSVYVAYDDSEDPVSNCFKLHILSNRYFQYESCKSRILAMNLPQMANMIDSNERFIYLTSNINFSEVNTIKSLGVLLYFLEKHPSLHQPALPLPRDQCHFGYFNFNYVTVDQSTFDALEIFQQEWHPSTLKKGIYKKEGFSVFGIFNTCASKLGTFHLRKIFQQPITDYDVLFERQETIEFFVNPENAHIKDVLLDCLKNIKDISLIFSRFKSSDFQLCDFKALLNILLNAIMIRNAIARLDRTRRVLFSQITKIFTNDLEKVVKCLQKTIDFENSDKFNIEVFPNIDSELDELKKLSNMLPQVLNQVLLDESAENNLEKLNFCNMTNVYVPQIGFLLAVPMLEAHNVTTIEEYGFETIFCANDQIFYKNRKMKEFDLYYGDIAFNITEQTRKVLVFCREFIFQHKKTIRWCISLCAQLDAIIAMANAAITYNYTRPTLSLYGEIRIEEGRHPLHELLDQSFVANPFESNRDERKVTLIFGPNSCGKSVYLKQVSLIVYLAHIGSFVPATVADITIVDQIFTRIRTPESVSTQMSSFKHDLNQIIMATKYASRSSLVVIDYFGKGTLSIDGFSLLTAVVKHWIANTNRPHIVISSQFNLISVLANSPEVNFYTFQTTDATHSFSLTACDHQTGENDDRPFGEILAGFHPRIEKLLAEDYTQELTDAFPELAAKYNKYIELATLLVTDYTPENCIDQLSVMINSLTTT